MPQPDTKNSGLALICYLLEKQNVRELCRNELKAQSSTVAADVGAVIAGRIPCSSRWQKASDYLYRAYTSAKQSGKVWGAVRRKDFSDDLRNTLHSLVSGTLDVDRMDYLIRDSHYCGVPYGHCDVEMLVSNLELRRQWPSRGSN